MSVRDYIWIIIVRNGAVEKEGNHCLTYSAIYRACYATCTSYVIWGFLFGLFLLVFFIFCHRPVDING